VKRRSLLGWSIAAVPTILTAMVVVCWVTLRASLPILDGSVQGKGLSAEVTIDRDALGVPTINGSDRADLAYATGFLHAQDRFFQMDLLRRSAAGELAELFGPVALDLDRRQRLHQFRMRSLAVLTAASPDERRLIESYTRGINDGLNALSARPFEYMLLRETPAPWRPEDSILVAYSMYFELQYDELESVLARAALRDRTSDDMFRFLLPDVSHWDAPLDQTTSPIVPIPSLPSAKPNWSLSLARSDTHLDENPIAGSNSWAVVGLHTSRRAALLANDMHLGLRLPNIWYRLSLVYPDASGKMRRVTGASLPGTPAIIVGSNSRVAWGFTNSSGHYLDLISLDGNTVDGLRRREAGDSFETVARQIETIKVKGGAQVDLPIVVTRWGPVIAIGNKNYAIHWTAHDPNAINLHLMRMEDAANVTAAIKIGQTSGIPTQNLVVADLDGHIGWSLAGPLPRHPAPGDGLPVFDPDNHTWSEYLTPDEYPVRYDPSDGRLWTANNRQLSDKDQDKIGGRDADLGARASQIRDDLFLKDSFDENAFLSIQRDDRALWIDFWRRLLTDALDGAALDGHPQRAQLKQLVTEWNGRADADVVGYSLVRSFYQSMYDAWFGGLDTELRQFHPKASYRVANRRAEAVMETLAERHAWIPPGIPDWRAFLLNRIDLVIAKATRDGARLQDARWGSTNTSRIAHPLVRSLPWLRTWLAVPPVGLPGDVNMPLVQAPEFGASERMVVAPGHEDTGIFHMPGGQSGHPLSPFFLAGHEAWVRGDPTPFLPGPTLHQLTMQP
jgi:penicillin G amidase